MSGSGSGAQVIQSLTVPLSDSPWPSGDDQWWNFMPVGWSELSAMYWIRSRHR